MTTEWRKSSHSTAIDDEACVELARFPSAVGVRDSKNPGLGALSLTGGQFTTLVEKLKNS